MDIRPIGIMDSGSGGLSIYKALRTSMPSERFIYIGDHRFVPYGRKTPAFIRRRVISIIKTLLTMDVKCIVIACNTSTVVGIDAYRKRFPGIPIIGVVPVIKTGVAQTKTGNVAVISTVVTSESMYLKELIKKFAKEVRVVSIGNSRIVSWIESGTPRAKKSIAKDIQEMKKKKSMKDVDVIVLGCTHFPFVRDMFRKVFGKNVPVIDSGMAVARQVRNICEHNGLVNRKKCGSNQYFTTGNPVKVSKVFSALLHHPTVVRSIAIA